jgi:hypothetical protein
VPLLEIPLELGQWEEDMEEMESLEENLPVVESVLQLQPEAQEEELVG